MDALVVHRAVAVDTTGTLGIEVREREEHVAAVVRHGPLEHVLLALDLLLG